MSVSSTLLELSAQIKALMCMSSFGWTNGVKLLDNKSENKWGR